MVETVLITGASGLIGRHLSAWLKSSGYRVLTLSRKPSNEDAYQWDPETGCIDGLALQQVDHLIHLAGAGIGDQAWTTSRKAEIRNSRIQSCELLFRACQEQGVQLKSFLSASAVGFYGDGSEFTEKDPAGEGFLATVCKDWEAAADRFRQSGVRTCTIRTGIVLAKDGGILPQMALPVRWGLGSALGSGKQSIPWIHVDDVCRIYQLALQDVTFSGAYNAVAPEMVSNQGFSRELAKVLHKPFWPIAVPSAPLRWVLGERSELLLKGSSVKPVRLLESGFDFQYPVLKAALNDLLD